MVCRHGRVVELLGSSLSDLSIFGGVPFALWRCLEKDGGWIMKSLVSGNVLRVAVELGHQG